MSGEKPELFLFVWDEFFPECTYGLAVAVAETMEQAQEAIRQHVDYDVKHWGPMRKLPVTEPIAFAVPGGAV